MRIRRVHVRLRPHVYAAQETQVTVAALYVQRGGVYWDLEGVDAWDEARDARLYAGPHPVVAHPPCGRWSMLAKLVQATSGHKLGDDGGCFEAALRSVRAHGGVLEHPAWSWAFKRYDLGVPRAGSWQRMLCGGWTTHVNQAAYGHPATKATWLYYVGDVAPPPLDWRDVRGTHVIGAGRRRGDGSWYSTDKPSIKKGDRIKTPLPFRDLLLAIARQSRPPLANLPHPDMG